MEQTKRERMIAIVREIDNVKSDLELAENGRLVTIGAGYKSELSRAFVLGYGRDIKEKLADRLLELNESLDRLCKTDGDE